MDQAQFRFVPRDDSDAETMVRLALEDGADDATFIQDEDDALGPGTAIVLVIVVTAGLAAITRVADWLRARNDCLLVIDAREGHLLIEERCDIAGRRGQVIVVTGANEQVVIQRSVEVLDLDRLMTAAVERSADVAIAAAKAVGAEAAVENPPSPL